MKTQKDEEAAHMASLLCALVWLSLESDPPCPPQHPVPSYIAYFVFQMPHHLKNQIPMLLPLLSPSKTL